MKQRMHSPRIPHVSTPMGDEEVKVVDNEPNNITIGGFQNYIGMEHSQSDSAIEEMCPIHGDILVAYSKKLGKLICNQCIYADMSENDQDPIGEHEMDFTSYVAQELKELFDDKFNLYKT